MEEKLLKEMIALLKDIKESVAVSQMATVRGPVADPGPDPWPGSYHNWPFPRRFPFPPLPIGGDPAIGPLIPKEELVKIRIKELDMTISQITHQIDLIRMQRDLLAREYKIK